MLKGKERSTNYTLQSFKGVKDMNAMATGGGRKSFFDWRNADMLSWGALIFLLFSIAQLISVGKFHSDLILSWFGVGMTDATRGDMIWAWGTSAVFSFVIATGQLARLVLAMIGITSIIGGIGTTIYFDKKIDFSFDKLVAVELSKSSASSDYNKPKSVTAIQKSGLLNCGALNEKQLEWCEKDSRKGGKNKNSSDLAALRCGSGRFYRKSCKD